MHTRPSIISHPAFLPIAIVLLVSVSANVAEGQTWEQRANFPSPRQATAAAAVGGEIYVAGGRTRQSVATRRVDVYDPVSDSWARIPGMLVERSNAAAINYRGNLVVIGGRSADSVLAKVEMYDADLRQWIELPSLNEGREGLTAAVVGDHIFVIGGSNKRPQILKTCEIFDPAQQEWLAFEEWQLATPAVSLASVVVRDAIFAIGGVFLGPISRVDVYETAGGAAIDVPDLPVGLARFSAVAVGDTVFVIGGVNSLGTAVDDVHKLAVGTNGWKRVSSLSSPRQSFSAATVEGTIYAVGGVDDRGNVIKTVEALYVGVPVGTAVETLPGDFRLEPPAPNPFSDRTIVNFSVSESGRRTIQLDVYDVLGRRVRELETPQALPPGIHDTTWDGRDDTGYPLPSGLYFVRLGQGAYSAVQKVVLLR